MLNPHDLREFSPDGLDEASIDALISEVADELAELPPATSALLDGTARKRRNRRVIERTLGSTVRVLHVYGHMSATARTEAA
ncbi:hypothetical protein SAMN04488074_12929 [Lentzea albidocapillata subsp. violacea]|uniref:Uncharacterized protein n=1 Tax=Lentzea albidocapillata subsp. violacea TaxID=128104 RepID=A0A1G9X3M7_9PSEU|nr:hypothetical protein [Lentzea albidocapillata]SDM91307.1 hypothetical protein SAMN04488074_12929 [Lentzea albidocapillata subsp. violacea]